MIHWVSLCSSCEFLVSSQFIKRWTSAIVLWLDLSINDCSGHSSSSSTIGFDLSKNKLCVERQKQLGLGSCISDVKSICWQNQQKKVAKLIKSKSMNQRFYLVKSNKRCSSLMFRVLGHYCQFSRNWILVFNQRKQQYFGHFS